MDIKEMQDLKEQYDKIYAELHRKVMEAYTAEFLSRPEASGGGQKQIIFQMIYAEALVNIAAVLGVDSGMTEDMFKTMADENFKAAYKAAPKFG